jgi:hypothetical protein
MQLRQAVDGKLEKIRTWMLEAVPTRVVVGIAQPEVGTEVDDGRACRDEIGNEVDRRAMREGKERGVDLG